MQIRRKVQLRARRARSAHRVTRLALRSLKLNQRPGFRISKLYHAVDDGEWVQPAVGPADDEPHVVRRPSHVYAADADDAGNVKPTDDAKHDDEYAASEHNVHGQRAGRH